MARDRAGFPLDRGRPSRRSKVGSGANRVAPFARISAESRRFRIPRSRPGTGRIVGMSLIFREFLDQFAVEPPHLLRAFDHQWSPSQRGLALVANMFRSIRENDRQICGAARRSEKTEVLCRHPLCTGQSLRLSSDRPTNRGRATPGRFSDRAEAPS